MWYKKYFNQQNYLSIRGIFLWHHCQFFHHKSHIEFLWFQWSYGVLLWEIYTFGKLPHAEISDLAVYNHLKMGNHLMKPAMTDEKL